jgi:hypothetical protein
MEALCLANGMPGSIAGGGRHGLGGDFVGIGKASPGIGWVSFTALIEERALMYGLEMEFVNLIWSGRLFYTREIRCRS